jgi:hypothetical protein
VNSEAPNRTVPCVAGFSRNSLAVVLSLVASSAFGVAVAGSKAGFVAAFLGLLVISSIMLSPVCAKRNGYRTAIGIGVITILTAAGTLVSGSMNSVISPEGLSAFAWAAIQIAVIQFAYSAYRENKLAFSQVSAV